MKKQRLVLGLMSGTSADGIDVALVRTAVGPRLVARGLENFVTLPFPAAVRAEVLRIAEGGATSSGQLSQLNFRLGRLFAQSIVRACGKFRVRREQIDLIGSHGQTIYHQGMPSPFLGARVASTLQIGEPAVIAAETGITTVADFRPADMAVGGQGAPLVPWVDYRLYRDARHGRAALNIGGIANITVIPRNAKPEEVFAFDIGPGNMAMDGLVRHFTHGRQGLRPRRAHRRARREPPGPLLDALLADAYFRRPPPKTAGREQYGAIFLRRILAWGRKHRVPPADLVRTATIFTALSIADAFHRWVLPRARVAQLIVAGGGARNPLHDGATRGRARWRIEIVRADELGVPVVMPRKPSRSPCWPRKPCTGDPPTCRARRGRRGRQFSEKYAMRRRGEFRYNDTVSVHRRRVQQRLHLAQARAEIESRAFVTLEPTGSYDFLSGVSLR